MAKNNQKNAHHEYSSDINRILSKEIEGINENNCNNLVSFKIAFNQLLAWKTKCTEAQDGTDVTLSQVLHCQIHGTSL